MYFANDPVASKPAYLNSLLPIYAAFLASLERSNAINVILLVSANYALCVRAGAGAVRYLYRRQHRVRKGGGDTR